MNGVQACLTGYVAKDADMRYTSTGKGMLTFSLAVADAKKQEGQESEWVRCVIFGQLAEDLQLRMVKGTHTYCEGRVKLNKWTAADGSDRSGLELLAWTC
jgi:single-strand DNA-binding protein